MRHDHKWYRVYVSVRNLGWKIDIQTPVIIFYRTQNSKAAIFLHTGYGKLDEEMFDSKIAIDLKRYIFRPDDLN